MDTGKNFGENFSKDVFAIESIPNGVPSKTPLHPGEFLQRHYFRPMRLSQTKVALLLGISRRRVNEIVLGRRHLSVDSALRCSKYLGVDATFLMHLQASWDVYHAWKNFPQLISQPVASNDVENFAQNGIAVV
jgi:addiction module HigA family antidote